MRTSKATEAFVESFDSKEALSAHMSSLARKRHADERAAQEEFQCDRRDEADYVFPDVEDLDRRFYVAELKRLAG